MRRLVLTPVVQAQLTHVDSRPVLVFPREFAHAPARVWRVLTDPEWIREWAPFEASRDLSSPGRVGLQMPGDTLVDPFENETVRHAQAERLLEFTWGGGVLRWELTSRASGTQLVLHNTLSAASWAAKIAAGWHICLDVADRFLGGDPLGRIVGADAKQHGWNELHNAYRIALGPR